MLQSKPEAARREKQVKAWTRAKLENAELLLVGQPTSEGKALLTTSAANFEWLPQIPKHSVPEVMSSADVLVMPSLSESWGLVVGEALASGLPVVVSDTTGFPLRDGVDGFVVRTWSPRLGGGPVGDELGLRRGDRRSVEAGHDRAP